jgi:hypothetical protein
MNGILVGKGGGRGGGGRKGRRRGRSRVINEFLVP